MERLYRRHAAMLLGLATRVLGQRSEADDAVHDAFLKILRRVDQLRKPDDFGRWASRIVLNECRKRLKRRRRYIFGSPEEAPHAAFERMASNSGDPEVATELRWLATHIQRLPADERIVWMLRHVEGYALEECASLAGCSLATVKRRLQRAERRLGTGSPSRGSGPADVGQKRTARDAGTETEEAAR